MFEEFFVWFIVYLFRGKPATLMMGFLLWLSVCIHWWLYTRGAITKSLCRENIENSNSKIAVVLFSPLSFIPLFLGCCSSFSYFKGCVHSLILMIKYPFLLHIRKSLVHLRSRCCSLFISSQPVCHLNMSLCHYDLLFDSHCFSIIVVVGDCIAA